MIPLAISIAILDEHTRLACLETNGPRNAAIGTAASCHYFNPFEGEEPAPLTKFSLTFIPHFRLICMAEFARLVQANCSQPSEERQTRKSS
jgi:hypothetical protein